MASTVLATALPYSLADRAPFHLTVFFTHKLVADPPPPEDPDRVPVLGDFPSVADWVTTLAAGTLTLTSSLDPAAAIPLRVVSAPSAASWAAALPPLLAVAGFPTPSLAEQAWHSNPAHRLSDHAVDLHLAALTAAPTRRPALQGDPVAVGLLRRMSALDQDSALTRLLGEADNRARRAQVVVGNRMQDALTTLGPLTEVYLGRDQHEGPPLPHYRSDVVVGPSPVEVLLDDADADTRLTARLDGLLGEDLTGDPQLQLMVDAHAMRRYYERPDEPKQPARREPDPDAPPRPRPSVPEQEFHARVASFGATPVLLRALGLAVDVVIDAPDARSVLAGAQWVSVTFTPSADREMTELPPRRTAVVVVGDVFTARSSADWVGGALPLGDDGWRVLDLDPDASGLKLDQHVRGLSRSYAAEANGDPATSAPGTLRTTGFAIARVDRATATRARVAAAEQLAADDGARELLFDDVVRGIRVEVWDDATKEWHSLHRRRVTVVGEGGIPVVTDLEDTGFLQLSGLNRSPDDTTHGYYLHEVVAGWDGWSLSAPRPGRVIVHVEPPGPDGETEVVVDTPPDPPASGVHTTTRVQPGSLPRLRYGTSYSFRILGVDLAGNSVPQRISRLERVDDGLVDAAQAHLDGLRDAYRRRDEAGLVAALRDEILEHLGSRHREPNAASAAELGEHQPELPEVLRSGDPGVDAAAGALLALAGERARGGAGGAEPGDHGSASDLGRGADLLAGVDEATRVLLQASETWRVRPQLDVHPDTFARVAALDDLSVPDDVRALRRPVVTVPRPYLRWEPVPPPALVARRALGTGEQLSRLVVRSGRADDDSPTSERHVLPPKATQLEAEAAGRFDAAIGTGDAVEIARLYAVALAERGTLLDQQVPSLVDANATVEQPNIALLSRPGADPATQVTLSDIQAERGRALGEGQYVVHDVEHLRLPYLPEPYAHGISLVFWTAGAPHVLPEPRVLQAVTVAYPGAWPAVEPLRLVLHRPTGPAATLSATAGDGEVHVTVPPGEQVRVSLASTVAVADLDRFGLWRSHLASTIDPDGDGGASQDEVVAAAALMRAASSGWTWWLTPPTDLQLVHAVPAPVVPPRLVTMRVLARPKNRGVAALGGVVDVHGASTERLLVRASWDEQVDDLTADGPVQLHRSDVVVNSAVAEAERTGVLYLIDFLPFGGGGLSLGSDPSEGTIGLHAAIQKFPDTHYRRVTYVPSGSTRYREFFDPAEVPADDDPALGGEPVTVDVPSSARPTAPRILDTVPLLRWEGEVEPAQPFARRQVRRSGVRIWLDRPWYSSGDGELLAVLVFEPYEPDPANPGTLRLKAVQAPDGATSLWGNDPTIALGGSVGTLRQATAPPLVRAREILLEALAQQPLPRDPVPGRPVVVADAVPLLDVAGMPSARVYGYLAEYDAASRRWFVDIALEDGPALWPFVRLAVARYQPHSIPSCELSQVALTSWVQPLPTRWLTVSRRDGREVQVTLSGTVSHLRVPGREDQLTGYVPGEELSADTPTGRTGLLSAWVRRTRTVTMSLQHLPAGASDLQWQTTARRELRAVSVDEASPFRATWTGSLQLPADPGTPAGVEAQVPDLQTPGSSSVWRVLVEEHELLDADDPESVDPASPPIRLPRLVYADTVAL